MLSYCTRIAARPPSQPDSRRSAVTITHGLNDEFPLQGCSRSDVACCGREVPTKVLKGKHVRIGSRQSQAKIRGLGLLRIRGRQNPQTRSPQTRTMGRGGKRVFAGDGGYGGRGVDRRRQRIPGREAISRGQGAERGEEPKKRARDTMAPLSNKTQLSTYPQIPQEFPTGYVYSWLNMTNRIR